MGVNAGGEKRIYECGGHRTTPYRTLAIVGQAAVITLLEYISWLAAPFLRRVAAGIGYVAIFLMLFSSYEIRGHMLHLCLSITKQSFLASLGLGYDRIITILSDRDYMKNLLSQFNAMKQMDGLVIAK